MLPIGIEDKTAAEENGEPEIRIPGTGQEIRDLGGKRACRPVLVRLTDMAV